MTYQEAREVLKSRVRVSAGGIIYKHINAIIFRKTDKIELIQLELQDQEANSVKIARINDVEVYKET